MLKWNTATGLELQWAVEKILPLKTEHLEQWAIASGSHAQPDTEQIEHYSKLGQEKSRT
jgi:hypothetical protein